MNGFQLRFDNAYTQAKNMAREDLKINPIAYSFARGYRFHDILIKGDKRGHIISFLDGKKAGYKSILEKLQDRY